MPRNGSGVYSLPGGSTITNGDTSDSTDVNTPLADIVTDLNTARPIIAGGTGATTILGARNALGVLSFDDVAAVIADTSLTYTASQAGTVAAGDLFSTVAEGFAYEVAASGASDQHVTTAGGVKLYVQKGRDSGYDVTAFGALGDDSTDSTTAIQKAIDVAFAAGGAAVFFPAGTYLVTGLALDWGTAQTSMTFMGEGKNSTVIKKTGVTTDAVFDLSATLSDGSYTTFANMHIIGIATCNGFTATQIARSTWHNVRITSCNVAFDAKGSLINSFYDCDFRQSVIGYRARVNGGIYCNLVNFYGGSFNGNTTMGLDIGDTNGLYMRGVDIESNTSGAMVLRSTCDDEIGFSNIELDGVWFEGNGGTTLDIEACAGLVVGLRNVNIINPTANDALQCGVIQKLTIDNLIAGSPADAVIVAPSALTIRDSVIGVLTNNAEEYTITNLSQNSGATQFQSFGANGGITLEDNGIRADNLEVSAPTSTATTLFTTSGTVGAYLIYAAVTGVGTTYLATATAVTDGAGAVALLNNASGANISLSVSGADVQVTQISGVTQTVNCKYMKVA